jgi:hypothetical protein
MVPEFRSGVFDRYASRGHLARRDFELGLSAVRRQLGALVQLYPVAVNNLAM